MQTYRLFGIAVTGCLALAAEAFGQGLATDYRRIDVRRNPSNWAFGVNLAAANVDSLDNSVFSFGVFGDYFTSPSFALGLSLDYWNDSFNTTGTRRVEVDDLALGGHGKFLFTNVSRNLRPFVLAGLAVHRFQVDVAKRDPNAIALVDKFNEYDRNTQDVEGELGADFAGGFNYRVQPMMDMVAEVRYRRILDRTVDLDQVNYSVALSYIL